MPELALRRIDLSIGDFAQFIMGEIVRGGALFAYNSALPKLVQRAHDTLFIALARLRQNVETELPAHHRCQRGQLAGGRGKLREASRNNRADASRQVMGCGRIWEGYAFPR